MHLSPLRTLSSNSPFSVSWQASLPQRRIDLSSFAPQSSSRPLPSEESPINQSMQGARKNCLGGCSLFQWWEMLFHAGAMPRRYNSETYCKHSKMWNSSYQLSSFPMRIFKDGEYAGPSVISAWHEPLLLFCICYKHYTRVIGSLAGQMFIQRFIPTQWALHPQLWRSSK